MLNRDIFKCVSFFSLDYFKISNWDITRVVEYVRSYNPRLGGMTGTNLEANDKKTYARLPLPLVKCVDAELAPPTEQFFAIVDILLKATE